MMTDALVALDSAKADAFALDFAVHGNAARAYRAAYDCAGMQSNHVKQRAYELRWRADVAARVRALQAEAASKAVIDITARMQWLDDIVNADPNDIVQHVRVNCRHCHGVGFAYQWRDACELARALDDHLRSLGTPKPLRMPATASGGYGYSPNAEPNADCPHCAGDGIGRTIIADTSKLSGPARRLLKGVRQKANGDLEVLMHDQLAAADQLNKMQAVYVTKSISATYEIPAASKQAQGARLMTPEELIATLWRGPQS